MAEKRQLALETMRHSFAHILAMAVQRLYPGTKLGIGPATETGFYYDLDIPQKLSAEDLPQIEGEMKKIIHEELPFRQLLISREQAFDTLHQLGQVYKTELLQQVPDEQISFFRTGEDFIDLCRGPHVRHTGLLGVFKLTGISGVYWQGDSSRPQMQRIEGVGFKRQEDLDEYLMAQGELKQREHRRLGKDLDLFIIDEELGAGLPVWLVNGALLKRQLQNYFYDTLVSNGFSFIDTPEIARKNFFRTDLIEAPEGEAYLPEFKFNNDDYLLRQNGLFNAVNVFNTKNRSYKELPLRLAEFALGYNNQDETNGSGLLVARRYTLTDSYIFSPLDDTANEIKKSLEIVMSMLKTLGLDDFRLQVALPKIANKTKEELDLMKETVTYIQEAIGELNLNAKASEVAPRYFCPEVYFMVKDLFGREWEIARVGVELILPEQLALAYADNKNEPQPLALINFRMVGSLERLVALLIENLGGAFPAWLSPVQAVIISISEKFNVECEKLQKRMLAEGIRVQLDKRDEPMQAKIRDAQLAKIPYMLIMGEKEISTNSISVRPRSGQDLGLVNIEEFIEKIVKEIENKTI